MRTLPLRLPSIPCLLLALAVAGCGGGSGTPPPPASLALVPAQSGDLVRYVTGRLALHAPGVAPAGVVAASRGAPADAALAAVNAAAPTGTLVQEAGIDEDDLLKTAGSTVLSLAGSTLRRHRWDHDGLTARDTLALAPDDQDLLSAPQGLYLREDGGRAVVLSQSWRFGQWLGDCPADACAAASFIAYVPTAPKVHLSPVTLGDSLSAGSTLTLDGRLVGSRRVGDRLIVVSVHVPALAFDALPATATAEERATVLAALRADDLLPTIRVGNAAAVPLVAETDCYLQPGNASQAVEITTVTVFDLASPDLARQSRCFVGGSEAMYMSSEHLVLATTRVAYDSAAGGPVYPTSMSTDVHRFAMSDGVPQYRASGNVPGHLGWDGERKALRFSEHGGDLRVLTFTGSMGWLQQPATDTPASPATLTVLRESAGALQAIGQLPNARQPAPIGKPGEQVYAVRFVGDRGYVVTFRRTDPLYVLDLSDPADPRAAGVLEVPGFAQDLFEVGSGWLLGVGRDADADGRVTGIAVSLFDVRDATAPRRQALALLGDASSSTALDYSPHGLGLQRGVGVARAALPVVLPVEGRLQRTLQRFDIDTEAGTLVLQPSIVASSGEGWPDVSRDRAQLRDDQVLHLSGDGGLALHDW